MAGGAQAGPRPQLGETVSIKEMKPESTHAAGAPKGGEGVAREGPAPAGGQDGPGEVKGQSRGARFGSARYIPTSRLVARLTKRR